MSDRDPFDRVRKSNPIDPTTLPGALPGPANRNTAERNPRRFRISGPALGLVSMAFVLVVGALMTTIMRSGSDETVVTQASTTSTANVTTSSTTALETTTVRDSQANPDGSAPWSGDPLPRSVIPQHLLNDWAKAKNRIWCS
ncbi:MAG: hypothetical protein ACXW1Y_13075, partial [Acidimicrobiia bacterium]